MNHPAVEIRISLSSCGIASGAGPVLSALEDATRRAGAEGIVKTVGCNGMCSLEPLVEVVEANGRLIAYGNVTTDEARRIVRAHVRPNRPFAASRWTARRLVGALVGSDSDAELRSRRIDRDGGPHAPSHSRQTRIVLENCGEIDPRSLDDYICRGGYRALERCLGVRIGTQPRNAEADTSSNALAPEDVIAIITESGLRGRGGAGFPTGRKWSMAREQSSSVKFVICNGDEGDPGAFMDRLLLEADPHRVVEGLAIAAYSIGATEGIFYIRSEYPLAVPRVRQAIKQAEARGYLGPRIGGTDFSLQLTVQEGAGAFACGEETALIASLEGRRGMPHVRPPFPVEVGFRGKPTLVNNVETLACVPWIIRHGAAAFASLGTETSKGTKVFALAGKIKRGGLIEVPMGTTIREIVEGVGGGIKDDRQFKAVQLGGPSGGCLPETLADTPIDYDSLARTGAIMGSGGLIVLDDRDCMVDIARFFLRFTQAESCGKCTFCRVGTKRMLEILDRLCTGEGRPGDLESLEELADRVSRTSLCGLGQTAPNPVATTLKYFRSEYEAHLHDRRCPAGRCVDLIHYRVTDACIGCTLCAQDCPVGAIEFRPYEKHEIDDALCTRCDICRQVCQDDAIEVA